jgi:hypothetical protein
MISSQTHGSQEVGKGLEKKILKDAGLKLEINKGDVDENNEQKD